MVYVHNYRWKELWAIFVECVRHLIAYDDVHIDCYVIGVRYVTIVFHIAFLFKNYRVSHTNYNLFV